MTELERWMNDHPPLADALTAEETAALRQKVLARRPKPRVLRGWRLAAAAAALCLVAAGAVVLGLFHPMSAANETNALVQKYGEVLDEPLTAEINGHTVSVKALLRDKNTLRVLYDVDNAKGMEPNDLVWDTGAFYLRTADNSGDKRLYIASNAQVGPCYGYAIGSWATRNAVSEDDVLSCYVDTLLFRIYYFFLFCSTISAQPSLLFSTIDKKRTRPRHTAPPLCAQRQVRSST